MVKIGLLLLIFGFGASPARACRITTPLSDEMKAKAELVFEGDPLVYGLDQKEGRAKIVFKVARTTRGEHKSLRAVFWQNGNFGMPKSLAEFKKAHRGRLEVGALDEKSLEKAGAVGKKTAEGWPWVLQGPCSEPYLQQPSRK